MMGGSVVCGLGRLSVHTWGRGRLVSRCCAPGCERVCQTKLLWVLVVSALGHAWPEHARGRGVHAPADTKHPGRCGIRRVVVDMMVGDCGSGVAVSRILFPTGLAARGAAIISLRRRLPAASSSQPGGGRASNPRVVERTRPPLLLSGLAPDGVYLSRPVTRSLVSSYLAISTLPDG